jgi:hypothetical protein
VLRKARIDSRVTTVAWYWRNMIQGHLPSDVRALFRWYPVPSETRVKGVNIWPSSLSDPLRYHTTTGGVDSDQCLPGCAM